MAIIGILGNEYDNSVKLLKVRIEDMGHKARIINFMHFPRVMRANLDIEHPIYDGHNLLDMGSFYLKDMGVREPFFHVNYSQELWEFLRPNYLRFADSEQDCKLFALNLLNILAGQRPMVNPPHINVLQLLVPYQLSVLSYRGYNVPHFMTGFTSDYKEMNSKEQIPIRLDEHKNWEVLSFPKNRVKGLRVWREKKIGTTYIMFFLNGSLLEHMLVIPEDKSCSRMAELGESSREVREIALKAAVDMNLVFGEVSVLDAKEEQKVYIMHIDPSPDFYIFEEDYDLPISGRLAEYLVNIAK